MHAVLNVLPSSLLSAAAGRVHLHLFTIRHWTTKGFNLKTVGFYL
jgi:hypothetical protein